MLKKAIDCESCRPYCFLSSDYVTAVFVEAATGQIRVDLLLYLNGA